MALLGWLTPDPELVYYYHILQKNARVLYKKPLPGHNDQAGAKKENKWTIRH